MIGLLLTWIAGFEGMPIPYSPKLDDGITILLLCCFFISAYVLSRSRKFLVQLVKDFLLNREEAHNQMFRDAFNEVQDSGSNQDFGTTKAAKMYFSLSNPGPNAFAGNEVSAPKFAK